MGGEEGGLKEREEVDADLELGGVVNEEEE